MTKTDKVVGAGVGIMSVWLALFVFIPITLFIILVGVSCAAGLGGG